MHLWRILVVVCCALVGCGTENTPSELSAPAVYRHAMDGVPGSLDPARASSVYSKFLAVNLYDTLYRYRYLSRPYELTPNLAESLPEISADGQIYTIRLKPGTRFIDDPAFPDGRGREVTAHDFVYSIKRHFDPGTLAEGGWLWQGRFKGMTDWKAAGADYDREVDGVRALDEHTIRIELNMPFPQLVHTLAQGFAALVPREAVEYYGEEFSIHPVGSGPFKLRSIDSARAVLDRNPDFRKEPFKLAGEGYDPGRQGQFGLQSLEGRHPPFMERIDIEFITEDAARWNALRSGDVHFIKTPAAQFDQVLEQRRPPLLAPEFSADYHLAAEQESGLVYTNFNLTNPHLGYSEEPDREQRNRALRCAIIQGFDWQRRNNTFFSGIGEIFSGVLPPTVPEFDTSGNAQAASFDPAGAQRLIEANGWTPETLPILEYGFPSSVTERQMFEQFRGFMEAIGYPRGKIQPLTFASFAEYYAAYSRNEVMLITTSWTMDYPDAENIMQLFYGPNAAPGANSANYANPHFDELFRKAAPMSASPERTHLYQTMNQMLIDDCVSITGLSRTLVLLWSKQFTMLPDRSFVGGYFLRFVDSSGAKTADQ